MFNFLILLPIWCDTFRSHTAVLKTILLNDIVPGLVGAVLAVGGHVDDYPFHKAGRGADGANSSAVTLHVKFIEKVMVNKLLQYNTIKLKT